MDFNLLTMAREGEISVLAFLAIVSLLICPPIQVLIAKLKGFRLMPALLSGCVPILNLHTMLGYILMAIFYKKPEKSASVE